MLGEGLEPTDLQQREEVLVFVLELIPLLDQWRHQLLDVFLEGEQEVGAPWMGVLAQEPAGLPVTQMYPPPD